MPPLSRLSRRLQRKPVAEFMKQPLDDGSRDSSSSGAMVTAADAARKRRADEATAITQRAARRKSFRQAAVTSCRADPV
jgi:hypothetical protein